MTVNQCPSCGQIDSIRKISAIVQEQTFHTTGTGGAIDSRGTVYAIKTSHEGRSQTAINLSGYQTPKLKGTKRAVIGFLGVGYSVICWMMADPEGLRKMDERMWILAAFTLFFIGMFFWGLSLRKRNSNSYQENLGKVNALNMRNAEAWYCGRCDVRFDEGGAF
jgi:ribosomal protein L37AE/L43A